MLESIPDFTFPMVKYGKLETPLDLRILLYKDGAKSNLKRVFNLIAAGVLSRPLIERMTLVTLIHEELTARLVGGGSKKTFISSFRYLRMFIAWAEEFDQAISLETVEDSYRQWCDFLLNRQRLKLIQNCTAYTAGLCVSSILDAALQRNQPLILTTRLRRMRRATRAVGVAADKQNLANTFAFGQLCLDIIDSLPSEVIYGPLPVKIRFRDGRALKYWPGLKSSAPFVLLGPEDNQKINSEERLRSSIKMEADNSLRNRSPLVNLRIMSELLVFIGQTGMNLSQAFNLRCTQYSYKSTIDGFELRDYKNRRQGEVLFEIFSEYKLIFQSYLVWRRNIFGSTTDRLFPLIRIGGALESSPPHYDMFRDEICKITGIPFISPKQLRKTRINWLLRQSCNPEQTFELAQHTKATLLHVYAKPSLQAALVEIIQFWKMNDPRLGGKPMSSPAPGVCNGQPKSLSDLPSEAPKPDCIHPGGCLFCEHHRDIDSEDYVWSIASMRYMNTVILQRFRPPAKGKADIAWHVELVIEVLTSKLKWFSGSNEKRKAWVDETTEKLAEGEFHFHWRYLIESAQGV